MTQLQIDSDPRLTPAEILRTLLHLAGSVLLFAGALAVYFDWPRTGLVLLLSAFTLVCPVRDRIAAGVVGATMALFLIATWAPNLHPDRLFAIKAQAVFAIFMIGTGLSRAGRASSRR